MVKVEREPEAISYNTPVPAELHRAVQERMSARGFNSKSEYVRALMRADVECAAQEVLEAKLVRAMQRGNMTEATSEFWEKLREEVLSGD